MEESESGVHHAEPTVMSVQSLSFLPNNLSQPFTDDGIIDIVVIDPTLVSCVVWWIDVDTLHGLGSKEVELYVRQDYLPVRSGSCTDGWRIAGLTLFASALFSPRGFNHRSLSFLCSTVRMTTWFVTIR